MNHHVREQDSRAHFLELTPSRRRALAAAAQALVDLLDALDSDADLEPDADDEDGGDDEPSGDEDEPSLGSLSARELQIGWADGGMADREDEHDGAEPDEDGEPALGATTATNQDHAWVDHSGWCGDESEPSLGWRGFGRGHPETAMRGYADDREATTGPRDEEWDLAEQGEPDAPA